ncbi:copper chaperone PCu(A)C [Oleomonas cavernae]|uniref:Copper chaperone PCu(A)C n=2 Tax=Oleomonas cavernae TaxID=2320859 RepID=A0A418WJD1_9PROT|nr:copper chaperone PCu(A)C [Oleomonas cavernae]
MNMLSRFAAVLALLMGFASLAQAHEYELGPLEILHPWSRATPGAATVGGGYFTIENKGDTPDRLVLVSSDIAEKVQIHEMAMSADGMSSMKELTDGLVVPAKGAVELKPGAIHLMFIGLKHPLKEGEPFLATLSFEKAGTVEVKFVVGPAGAAGGEAEHKHN